MLSVQWTCSSISDDSTMESSSLLQLTMREISYLQSCPCSGTSTSLNGTTPIGYMQHSVTPLSHVLCSTLWHHYVPLLCLMCNQPYSTLLGITWLSGTSQPFIWYGVFIRLIEFSIVTHCDAELIPREPFYDVPWIHTRSLYRQHRVQSQCLMY